MHSSNKSSQVNNHIPRSVIKTSRIESDWVLDVYRQIDNRKLVPCSELEKDKLPDGLNAYVFIVGALFQAEGEPKEEGTQLYTGDGMVYRLGFQNGKVTLRTRIAKTPCYYADLATQFYLADVINSTSLEFDVPSLINSGETQLSNFVRKNKLFSYFAAFRNGGPSRFSIILGSRNQLNTAFLRTHKNLLLTMDAGRPYQIDPDYMDLLKPAGSTRDWVPILPVISKLTWINVFETFISSAHYITDVSSDNKYEKAKDYFITTNYSTGYNGVGKKIVNKLIDSILSQKVVRCFYSILRKKYDPKKEFGRFTHLVRYFFEDQKSKEQPPMETWKLVLPNGKPVLANQSFHQLAITEDYIILADIAFKMEFSQIFSPFTFGFLKLWKSGKAYSLGSFIHHFFQRNIRPLPFGDLYIVNREDLDTAKQQIQEESLPKVTAQKVRLPREISHFAADYSNPGKKITLHVGHPIGWDVTEWINAYDKPVNDKPLRQDLQGMMVGTTDLNSLGKYVINGENGKIESMKLLSDSDSTWSLSLFTHRDLKRDLSTENANEVRNIYWLSLGFTWELIPKRIYDAYKTSNRVIPIENLPNEDKPITLLRVDTQEMRIADTYHFPSGCHVSSIQFVPSSLQCPEGVDESIHGFIVCVVLSDLADEFWIFHADDFNGKPVYRLSATETDQKQSPVNLAMTIHSTWLPNLDSFHDSHANSEKVREQSYHDDYQNVIDTKCHLIQKKLFDNIVKRNFIDQTLEKDFKEKLYFEKQ